jgi:hypothetical protein
MMTPEDEIDCKRQWDAYRAVSDVLSESEYTNGDLLFVMSVFLAELVKEGDLDFEEMFQDLRDDTLSVIKSMSDA